MSSTVTGGESGPIPADQQAAVVAVEPGVGGNRFVVLGTADGARVSVRPDHGQAPRDGSLRRAAGDVGDWLVTRDGNDRSPASAA